MWYVKCGQSARRFLAWPGHVGREPACWAGGQEQLRGAAGFSACPDWACGYPKCNVVMLLRTSENTGVVRSSVSSGVFTRVLWEQWVGEKQKRASNAAGASGGGGPEEKTDGHVLCATLAQRPHSIVRFSR
jgi:hypothetical protein